MAAAYRYADGGRASQEIKLLHYIEKFGVQAVLGRQLYAHEVYRMMMAESIVNVYQSFRKSVNAAAWANENPEQAELLNRARELAEKNDR